MLLIFKYIFYMLQPVLPRLACYSALFVKALFYVNGVIRNYLQSQTLLGLNQCRGRPPYW